MKIFRHGKRLAFLASLLTAAGLLACNAAEAPTTPTPPTAMQEMPATPPERTEDSWLVLTELPENPTQVDVGAEVYRLVCRSCHGDKGQGLTQDWIAQWSPEDQNCWQTKCHAANHPPEGFLLPHYVPPLVGSSALARFQTASDLHAYMSERMPWHAPGSLQDGEYWAVTAYLLQNNGIAPVPPELNGEQAAGIPLHQGQ